MDSGDSLRSPPLESEFLISPTSPEPTRESFRPQTSRSQRSFASVSDVSTRRGSSPSSLRPTLRRQGTYVWNVSGQEQADITEKLVRQRSALTAQWGIHWQTPLLMALLFTAGLFAAVGHHYFYSSLAGTTARNQLAMVRYGTGLAFVTKAALIGSVVIAYKQRIWVTMRNKPMSLAAIDSMFAVTENPLYFGNLEMVWKAKLASLLAAATWLMPIAAILSPAALTSSMATVVEATTCTVPTLNFTAESVYDFRKTTQYPGYSLSFYNTTGPAPAGYDWYDQPSQQARRLSTMAVLHRGYMLPDSPCGNKNCTYAVQFEAPAYDCQEIAAGSADAINAPFNHSLIAPAGPLLYNSEVDNGDYFYPNGPLNQFFPSITSDQTLGVFASEPIIWVGYTVNSSEPLPPNSPYAARWLTVMTPYLYRCEHKHALYDVEFTYTSQSSETKAITKNLTFQEPVSQNSEITPNIDPKSFIYPQNRAVYKLTASYHTLGQLTRNFLRGEVQRDNDSALTITRSDISETNLINQQTSFTVPDLGTGVQSFYQSILFSLLFEPHLEIAANTTVACIKTGFENHFNYHMQALWIGYAIIIVIAACANIIGLTALFHNGVTSDTLFSRVMVTTRNDTLDHLARGACLGGDPFPKDLRNVKVRFGVLTRDVDPDIDGLNAVGVVQHCAFGTIDETRRIEKGGLYS